jgi:hypothetical protein
MCLIAHVPAGKSLTREVFDNANLINPHGIGVMSIKGVEKFYGNKQLKRARQYVAGLAAEGIAHAIHWRFATHGTKGLALCHPFKLPNADVWLMHNGIIGSTAEEADDDSSDTLLYVNKLLDAPTAYPEDLVYWNKVCADIGQSNKGCVMYPDGKFIILNQDNGTVIDDIWYSNSYSLPLAMRPTTSSFFVPSRLRPAPKYFPPSQGMYGVYYNTGNTASEWGGPFGSMIYWSNQHKQYGFWEGNLFQSLKIEKGEVIRPSWMTSQPPPTGIISTDTKDYADKKCPRCMRFKTNPPAGFLPCWCREEDVAAYLIAQQTKVAGAGGPSAETVQQAPSAAKDAPCTHGVSNWEDCIDCIEELEEDSRGEVQEWLSNRRGGSWLNTAGNVIYLPKASNK